MKRFLLIAMVALTAFGLVWSAWRITYQNQLGVLNEFASFKLDQVLGQFGSEANKFRLLPTLIARRASVVRMAKFGPGLDDDDYFLSTLHLTNSTEIRLLKPDGSLVLRARKYSGTPQRAFRVTDQPYFQEALTGALGFSHAVDADRNLRSFNFARSVLDRDGSTIGVVTVEADIEQFEIEMRPIPETVMFVEPGGRIFLSNRSELVHQRLISASFGEPPDEGEIIPAVRSLGDGIQLWSGIENGLEGRTMLAVVKPVPLYEMDALLLVDTDSALNVANLMAALVAAILAALAIAAYAYDLRRRRLVEKLDLEQELNTILEARILRRTNELETAQSRLVEAAKMSALGKMSAGIGHELNQPIASIQNFAVNARKLLAMGKTDAVEGNLEEIDALTTRMNQIIKNLRSFARNEKTEIFEVNLSEVVEVAAQLSRPRLKNEGISLKLEGPEGECLVRGGQVRLQQVLVNLISNAADSVSANRKKGAKKRIEIAWHRDRDTTVLTVRDTGGGIADISKLFEPFYTTKAVDEGHGLGLGLSISYSIIRSFGGTLRGENHKSGGAVFTITLQNAPAAHQEAAQ